MANELTKKCSRELRRKPVGEKPLPSARNAIGATIFAYVVFD